MVIVQVSASRCPSICERIIVSLCMLCPIHSHTWLFNFLSRPVKWLETRAKTTAVLVCVFFFYLNYVENKNNWTVQTNERFDRCLLVIGGCTVHFGFVKDKKCRSNQKKNLKRRLNLRQWIPKSNWNRPIFRCDWKCFCFRLCTRTTLILGWLTSSLCAFNVCKRERTSAAKRE